MEGRVKSMIFVKKRWEHEMLQVEI